jgi:hypothetical protein
MRTDNFTASFTVDRSPEEVFAAVNNVRGWWSEAIVGSADKLGGMFAYRHKRLHRSTQAVTEFVPGKKVIWHVVDSELSFVKDRSEWKGTDIVFEIACRDGKTELRMTHVGLVPALECFSDCSGGWGFYFSQSLRQLITSGKGQPDPLQ